MIFSAGARTRCLRRAVVVVLAAVPAVMGVAAGEACAHPLGNFTVNRYDGLTFHPDRVEDLAVVDSAEIPTL
ncbi:high frequency lysogenization protein HflD, partial [Streptomyces sp. V4-01]|nr:high frequency lysogenization protein HflD [Streptomyces sp. V4-01]